MKHPPTGLSEETITTRLAEAYGIRPHQVTFLPLGEEGWCYRAEAENSEYFVKLLSQTNEANLRALDYLANESRLDFVVAALSARDDVYSVECGGLRMSVYPFLQGEHLIHDSVTPEQIAIIARQLRQLHDASLPKSIRAALPIETFNRHGDVAARVLDAAGGQTFEDEVGRELVSFIQGRRAEIEAILNRARELGVRCRNQFNSTSAMSVCHADIHPYNVILSLAGELRFIDWEGMLLAPRERDLMFYSDGPHVQFTFTENYGRDYVPDPQAITYYHFEWVVQEIADYGSRVFFRDLSPEAKRHAFQEFITLFEPGNVVEQAR